MPHVKAFENRIKEDNRAYLLYGLKDDDNNEDLYIGTQVRVLEVGTDDAFASGFFAKVKVKDKERRIDTSMLMARKDWERLITSTMTKALSSVLSPPQKPKKKKSKGA